MVVAFCPGLAPVREGGYRVETRIDQVSLSPPHYVRGAGAALDEQVSLGKGLEETFPDGNPRPTGKHKALKPTLTGASSSYGARLTQAASPEAPLQPRPIAARQGEQGCHRTQGPVPTASVSPSLPAAEASRSPPPLTQEALSWT